MKNGIISNKKEKYCDLLYVHKDESELINWIEQIETSCKNMINDKKSLWFQSDLTREDIDNMMSPLYRLYKSGVNVWVADCDASVSNVYEYKGKTPEFITGRGGTDFDPAIEYYNEHSHKFNTLIYLTDGECSAPTVKPKTPMLWVLCSDGVELKNIEEYPGAKVKIIR
jgi:hypothetical protein